MYLSINVFVNESCVISIIRVIRNLSTVLIAPYIQSFSVVRILTGVGNSVQRISNTCVLGTHQCIRGRGSSVCVRQSIDVGGHYHIARSPIVEIRRRICIGFAFGHESGSPHFVLRRWMAEAFSLSCVRCAEGSRVSLLAKEGREGGGGGCRPDKRDISRQTVTWADRGR